MAPHISYPDHVYRTLKYARKVIPGAWSRQIVDAGSTGHNSIALDSHGELLAMHADKDEAAREVLAHMAASDVDLQVRAIAAKALGVRATPRDQGAPLPSGGFAQ